MISVRGISFLDSLYLQDIASTSKEKERIRKDSEKEHHHHHHKRKHEIGENNDREEKASKKHHRDGIEKLVLLML